MRTQHDEATQGKATTSANSGDQSRPQHQIKYTSDAYPNLKRNPNFKRVDEEDIKFFKPLLGEAIIDGISHDVSSDLQPYNTDWMKKYRGHTRLVLKPDNVTQVSEILKYCNSKKLAVVPQGGNTGLVGGSVPVYDEIVINLARMNKIRSFDDVSGVLVADAGVVLQQADEHVASHKHIFPLDLGAKGSCQIGGNVATNAGGLRLLRYGSMHGNILGLEVVLPDGTVLDDLGTLRKNNTGYDLKQLFIGAEGTIGIITGVSILCNQRPKAVNVAYFGLESYEKVQEAYKEAKGQLSEILSAFELMDGASQWLYRRAAGKEPLLGGDYPFYCLVETSGSNSEHDTEKLDKFLEYVMGKEIVCDGIVAQDESQSQAIWGYREGVSEASQHWGGVYKYDLSIPLAKLYDIVAETRQRFNDNGLMGKGKPVVDVIGYGHMGDSNLHLNVCTRGYSKNVEEVLEPWVYEWVSKHNGSISAEHGLGLAKKPYIRYSRSETMMKLMKQLKDLYDPNGIMNPYKYI
ncbi:hypothetical protein K470DRAFT_220950 [Piedraia hortae CBS 480.64]|uniref:D-2-hydroxyglutarate dehydrogenase, mitochondrial n=1 Tax=Piedraia hortae CBS 480.64 TaxID=1314780 RepID=A0A6A7BUC6_9PEZI|nr:hypothetical protein K470DRAFT_220950 [Piedraia hortae CBS 480.64]